MYLTKQLTLFKTPLSPTYENVYDDYSTYTDYENFLLNNFQHIEIDIVDDMEVGRDKSVIDKNGIFSLVIKNHSSMDIHDYNYCCFETDKNTSSPLFAFILSVDSLNDSRTSPSCRINCQLDAWTHNIFDMQSGYDVNQVECRHVIESELSGENLYAIHYQTNEDELPLKSNANAEPKLLWARVTVGNEIHAINATSHKSCNSASAHKVSTTTPVFYIPLFVINPITGQIYTQYKTAQCYSQADPQVASVVRHMVDGNGNPIGLFCSGDEILSIELTYYAPYRYQFEPEGNRVFIFQIASLGFTDAEESELEAMILCNKSGVRLFTEKTFLDIPTGDVVYALGTSMYADDTNYTEERRVRSVRYQYPVRGSLILNNDGFYDSLLARLYCYPYTYKSVIANGNEYPIVATKDRVTAISVIEKLKAVKPIFRFSFGYNNNTTDYFPAVSLESNGQLVTTVDSLDYYMRNNGNKILTDTIKSFITVRNGDTAIMSGRIAGKGKLIEKGRALQESGALSMIDTVATIADAEKQMDSYNFPSSNALDNYFLQDYVYDKEYLPLDTPQLYELKRKLHDFGININQRLSVREKTHFTFDYVRTNNCRLPMIGNIDDRHEIETAYDRGITKWHISGNASSDYMRTFSKNIPNMDLVQQEYYSVG